MYPDLTRNMILSGIQKILNNLRFGKVVQGYSGCGFENVEREGGVDLTEVRFAVADAEGEIIDV